MANDSKPFDPKRARTKRPLPLWVDAFQRDLQHLSADECGAYVLILMAMWSRPSCDFPDDAKRLARIARVSTRTWNSRVGPALMELFSISDGRVLSKKLLEEAHFCEAALTQQSERKLGKKQRKTLKANDPPQSADTSTDQTTDTSAEDPTQQPNNPTVKIGGGNARDPYDIGLGDQRTALLTAIGVDPVSGMAGPNGVMLGRLADMQEARRWQEDLCLSFEEVLSIVAEVVSKKRDGPPKTFTYFRPAMERYAADKNQPKLQPAEGTANGSASSHGRPASRPNGSVQSAAVEGLVAGFSGALHQHRGRS